MFFQNMDLADMLIRLPAVLFGISIHEFFHAYTATRFGDETPRRQGRLTLNPIAHFDLIGFVMLMLAGFGWAKPVRINPEAFRHRKRDEILVAIAGPLSNLLSALFFAGMLKLMLTYTENIFYIENFGKALGLMLKYFILINIALAIFNMLPIPPLDGSHLISVFIPDKYYRFKIKLFQFGAIALILIILAQNALNVDILPLGRMIEIVWYGLLKIVGIQ